MRRGNSQTFFEHFEVRTAFTIATLDYKPAATGTYDIQVIVKDADGKTVTKGFKLTVN